MELQSAALVDEQSVDSSLSDFLSSGSRFAGCLFAQIAAAFSS